MARVSGKCPVCGAITRVNDEKERGHCVKCGAEINVSESIQLFQSNPVSETAAQTPSEPSQRQLRREQREREAESKAQIDQAQQRIHDMFQLCANEQDYLMLRPKIIEMDLSDSEKAHLLEALDNATKKRLKDKFESANSYKESQESSWSILLGFVVIIGIGLAVNHFFSMVWPGRIAIGLAVIGLFGVVSDRFNKKKLSEGKQAAALIEEYRKLGYKI